MTTHPRTEWYPADVMPVRNGIYERDYGDGMYNRDDAVWFCNFRNGCWFEADSTPALAKRRHAASNFQVLPWRGLTSEVVG